MLIYKPTMSGAGCGFIVSGFLVQEPAFVVSGVIVLLLCRVSA